MNIDHLRNEYLGRGFDLQDLNPNPILQFQDWFTLAQNTPAILEPNAMQLATCGLNLKPSIRTVLLKSIENDSFIFYSNYLSPKGQQIQENHNVALHFLWIPLDRQIRIQGIAHKLDKAKSEKYFKSRPKGAQIGAWASKQSHPASSRQEMEQKFMFFEGKFHEKTIPLLPYWGGYKVIPQEIEFWQGRPNRLHDRCLYKRESTIWTKIRLFP